VPYMWCPERQSWIPTCCGCEVCGRTKVRLPGCACHVDSLVIFGHDEQERLLRGTTPFCTRYLLSNFEDGATE
jgi:hypothetical protein